MSAENATREKRRAKGKPKPAKVRQFLVSLIAPCRCVPHDSEGQLFVWCELDASRCNRWGHNDETFIVRMR